MQALFTSYMQSLQRRIVDTLESLDPSSTPFESRDWERGEGGGGRACTLSSGSASTGLFEKAAVNISMIHGKLPPASVKQMATQHSSVQWTPDINEPLPFFAAGISIIIHPRSPNIPSAHANYRYFEITDPEDDTKITAWWFGGITDLTPYYVFAEDFTHFHQTLKDACDKHGPDLYPAFKKDCDGYFIIGHRDDERRGIGGLRFDDLCDEPHSLLTNANSPRPRSAEEIFAFVQRLGDAILPSYIPIIQRRAGEQWTDQMRRWQLLRRGRYAEFNLLYDRGTKFGLVTPGVQTENVLASMPEMARWEYMSDLGVEGDGSRESELVEILKNPREWAQ